MEKDHSIIAYKDYGKVNIKLKAVLAQRGMTRNHLARAIHTRFEVIDKWCDNNVSKIDADILAKLCYVLGCQISDLVEYQSP